MNKTHLSFPYELWWFVTIKNISKQTTLSFKFVIWIKAMPEFELNAPGSISQFQDSSDRKMSVSWYNLISPVTRRATILLLTGFVLTVHRYWPASSSLTSWICKFQSLILGRTTLNRESSITRRSSYVRGIVCSSQATCSKQPSTTERSSLLQSPSAI